jgi:tetratricopeptide (TPR) repeat protein
MYNFIGSNPEEDGRLLNLVEAFEARLNQKEIAFIDLLTVKEIFHFYLRHEKLEEAERLLDYADNFHEGSCAMLRLRALLEMEKKNWEEALRQTEAALSCNPNDTELKFLQTELLAHLDRYDEAMGLLRELLAIDLEPKNVFLQMGNVAQLCGRDQQSEHYYRQALHHAPDFLDAVVELAFLLQSVDRHQDAITVYDTYLSNYPYQSRAWYELGRLYGTLGMTRKAVEAFDFAIVIRSDYFLAHYYKGSSLHQDGQYLLALRAFLEANVCLSHDESTWYHIGLCAQQLGAYPLAIRYYQRLSQRETYQLEAWVGLGESLEASERFLEAVHYYRKAYRDDESCEETALRMARCEFKLGNLSD